jgi:hypothetical protein
MAGGNHHLNFSSRLVIARYRPRRIIASAAILHPSADAAGAQIAALAAAAQREGGGGSSACV